MAPLIEEDFVKQKERIAMQRAMAEEAIGKLKELEAWVWDESPIA